jgi:hypothetical protein
LILSNGEPDIFILLNEVMLDACLAGLLKNPLEIDSALTYFRKEALRCAVHIFDKAGHLGMYDLEIPNVAHKESESQFT